MKSPPTSQKAPDPKVAAGIGTSTDLSFPYTLPKAPTAGHWRDDSRLLVLTQHIHSQVTSLSLC